MSSLHELATLLEEALPKARIDWAEPVIDGGFGFLDIAIDGNTLSVQWREKSHFGLSSPEGHGYGEASDEIYQTANDAANRIVALLRSGKKTEPPPQVSLRELRSERRITQMKLAEILRVTQPAVSQLERRVDRMNIATLKMVVQAMGGTLMVQALFPDGDIRQIAIDDEEKTDGKPEDLVPPPKFEPNEVAMSN